MSMFRAGELNRWITIVKPTATETDGWDDVSDQVLYEDIPAQIRPMRGRERLEAKAITNTENFIVTIRYREGIDATCKVKYKDHTYEVQSVVNTVTADRYLELYCIEKTR